MPDNKNPIPFNPEMLTIRQSKEALDALHLIFAGIARVDAGEVDASNLLFHIRQQRDSLARMWER
jgi:hypothetical protein